MTDFNPCCLNVHNYYKWGLFNSKKRKKNSKGENLEAVLIVVVEKKLKIKKKNCLQLKTDYLLWELSY